MCMAVTSSWVALNWGIIFQIVFSDILWDFFFSENASGTNNTAMCVHYSSRQLGAWSCWWIFDERMDPLPRQVEYSVHTQSHTRAHTETHTETHTDTYTYTCTHTHSRWYSFLCCSMVLRQAGASEGDIRVYCTTPQWKAHQKMMPRTLHLWNHRGYTYKVMLSFSPVALKWWKRNTKSKIKLSEMFSCFTH